MYEIDDPNGILFRIGRKINGLWYKTEETAPKE